MTTETTEKTLPPPIPDVPYMHGIQSGDGMIHAVCRDNILWTLQDMAPTERHIHAFAACGAMVRVARDWGEFRRGTEWTDRYGEIRELCPYCCWEVALDLSTVEEELAAITPTGDELAALTRLMPDPLLVVNACRAVLASREKTDERDPDSSFWPQILAHLTAHRPMLLFPELCTDQCCDHDTKAECYAEADVVACAVCSIRAGGWAGEWAGDFECTVASPCSALLAAAERYGKGVPA